MRRFLTRVEYWSAAIVVLGQAFVQAEEDRPLPVAEPVVSVAEASPNKSHAPKRITEAAAERMVEAVSVPRSRPLFQHATYPAAWKAAQRSNRPILVFVSMPNCHYCVKMRDQVYHLNHVKELVASSFETIKVGRYSHAELVQKLHIKWYPTTVLVGPNNKILDVIEGYTEANQFQQRLQTGLASVNKHATTQTR